MWKVVRVGTWLYDSTTWSPIWIIESNYDPWYEMDKDDGQLEPGDRANLNTEGRCYWGVVQEPIPGEGLHPGTLAATSLEEACHLAEATVPSRVIWQD